MSAANVGKTVREIMKGKRGAIRTVPLEPGSPSWDDILDVVWEDLVKKAVADQPGFRTFKKLLGEGRFNK